MCVCVYVWTYGSIFVLISKFLRLDVLNLAKTRALMKSVVATNPTNASGWIAYARLEEKAGRIARARDIMADGCTKCPKTEETWLEAARLAKPEDSDKWLVAATKKYLPNSVRLWVERAQRQTDPNARRRVYRLALSQISNSVRLWNEAVSLEDADNARVLLARAVECVPQAVPLWLHLAKLSDFKQAMKVLNEARRKCPTSTSVWVAAAELEESRGKGLKDQLERIIATGIKKLQEHDVIYDRSVWVGHAAESEANGCTKTSEAIVETIGSFQSVASDPGLKHSRIEEAQKQLEAGHVVTGKALLSNLQCFLPKKKAVWLARVSAAGDSGEKLQVVEEATEAIPEKQEFWLMRARLTNGVDSKRAVLSRAQLALPTSESITLAAVKLETDLDQVECAREILRESREKKDSALVSKYTNKLVNTDVISSFAWWNRVIFFLSLLICICMHSDLDTLSPTGTPVWILRPC